MEPRIVERGAFTVMGVQSSAPYESDDFGAVWNEFMSHHEAIRAHSSDGMYYGVNFPTDDEHVMEYVAGMAVEGVDDVPDGVVVREAPGGSYAVFECTVKAIHNTYEYVFHEWLPSSGRTQDPSRPCFECYQPADAPVLICVPIVD